LPDYAHSSISYLEVLGFPKITAAEQQKYQAFFASTKTLPLTQPILERAARLRQQKKMSLGDALVAGTVLEHQLKLISRDKSDFAWITNLQAFDPFDPADYQ
jgi:hypothetical protein